MPTERPTGRTAAEWSNAFRDDFSAAALSLRTLALAPEGGSNAWISRITPAQLDASLERLRSQSPTLPLYGVPFAVKDNIDVAGWPTTAACPAFSYIPNSSSAPVKRLEAAGAVLIGKTNLDQFATGLTGTRSPYGVVRNPFSPDHVAGGSSAGSAVTVAEGWVPFALGTDTAGSGTIPAGFNNLVGIKPTRGRCSKRGVVPACPSLDSLAVLALTIQDAALALEIIDGFDPEDPWSRLAPDPDGTRALPRTLAIPRSTEWFGDQRAELAWLDALARVEDMGTRLQAVDFTPFFELASLLYHGPWLAERHAVVGGFVAAHPDAVHPVVRAIVARGAGYSASDVFEARHHRQKLLREVQELFARIDALLVPTAPTHPRLAAVVSEPLEQDSRLGRYTSAINLADTCALSLPAGFRADGLPFGITLIAPAWRDHGLLAWGETWQQHAPWPLGAVGIAGQDPATAQRSPDTPEPRPAMAGRQQLHLRRGRVRPQSPLPTDRKEKHA